jgi:hypothetical protein
MFQCSAFRVRIVTDDGAPSTDAAKGKGRRRGTKVVAPGVAPRTSATVHAPVHFSYMQRAEKPQTRDFEHRDPLVNGFQF